MQQVAVIADPHFHDINNRQGVGRGDRVSVRTLADTAESTRVFNESYHALPALLDDIVRRGIRHVAVAGDLTDDGQATTMAAAVRILEDYAQRFGVRFYATPGNHDLYAIHGRHHAKRFLNPDGGHTLVTSDAGAQAASSVERIVSTDMYCGGYETALPAMRSFGFFRDDRDLYWESPFGQDDALSARTFEIKSRDGGTIRRMIDASYLIEPVEGLWILSIDATGFTPRDGNPAPTAEKSYIDSTDAGWNSMLRNKPFILRWMTDVAERARRQGKKLIAFSHYPVLDTLGATLEDEQLLFGETSFLRRSPTQDVARAVASTGIKVHFSGHLHVNDTALWRDGERFLVNVSVPSMVGFPTGYKIATLLPSGISVETASVEVPGFDAAFALYRREAAVSGMDFGNILAARSHTEFLSRHLAQMVTHRYLPQEWPQDLARLVPLLSTGDLSSLAGLEPIRAADAANIPEITATGSTVSFLDMAADWYRLRKGHELALPFIDPGRLELYDELNRRFSGRDWPDWSLQARIARFCRMMAAYRTSRPSKDFDIDLAIGEVVAADYFGRTVRRQTGTA